MIVFSSSLLILFLLVINRDVKIAVRTPEAIIEPLLAAFFVENVVASGNQSHFLAVFERL